MNYLSSWGGAALLVAVLPAAAEQTLLAEQSEIVFVSRQMGVPVEGRFRQFDAELAFDPNALDDSRVRLSVDLGSVAAGAAEVEQELIAEDWFDTSQFPQAVFESSAFSKADGDETFAIDGELTIKGVTRPLTVPVTVSRQDQQISASGDFVIERLAFEIGAGEWGDTSLVADEVEVKFELVFSGAPSP